MSIRILFVDDEPRILDGLRRTLRPLREEWLVVFSNGGSAALQRLAEEPFDVIVTDMRMPEMSGGELLSAVRRCHPQIRRVILSGQSDLEGAPADRDLAHEHLRKPCTVEVLKTAIDRVMTLSASSC